MSTKYVILLALGILSMSVPYVYAQDVESVGLVGFDTTYKVGDQRGLGVDDGGFAPISYAVREPSGGSGLRSVGTAWGGVEFKALYEHRWIVPALRWGAGILSADNNITIRSRTGMSPVSATQAIRVTATPVAFLKVFVGSSVGTGWNLQVFDGLGTVDPDSGEIDDASLSGAVVRVRVGGTFQFDLAALIPGTWNHVVTMVSPRFTYGVLSSVDPTTAWSFENDAGVNYNGWSRQVTAVLGYQPPIPAVGTLGLLYESEQLLGDALERAEESASGDFEPAFRTDRVGLLIRLRLGDNGAHSLSVIPQIQRNRLPSDSTIFNASVQRRDTVGSYWDFYRVAAQYRFRL